MEKSKIEYTKNGIILRGTDMQEQARYNPKNPAQREVALEAAKQALTRRDIDESTLMAFEVAIEHNTPSSEADYLNRKTQYDREVKLGENLVDNAGKATQRFLKDLLGN